MSWTRLLTLADYQHGTFSAAQAETEGITERLLQRRVAHEGWERLHTGVFAVPGAPATYEQAAMAALLAVRPGRHQGERDLFVAARSAARLWGMTEARQRPVQLIAPFEAAPTDRGGLYVIRSRTLLAADGAALGPIDVTTPERTIIDLGRYAGRDELLDTGVTGVSNGVLVVDRLAERFAQMIRPPGKSKVSWLIAELIRQGRTDSSFERELRSFLWQRGFRPYPGVYPLRVDGTLIAMLDIAFPPERVYVNADGRRFHSDRRAFRMDRVRDNAIVAAGWLGLAVSVDEFRQSPERFAAQLATTLRSRQAALRGGSSTSVSAILHTPLG